MKKSILIMFLALTAGILSAAGNKDASSEASEPRVLNIYCYDAFSSEWGPGPALAEVFTEQTGIEINFAAPGDAVTVLSKTIMEKDNPQGDILIGPDNNLLARTLAEDILESYSPAALDEIAPELIFDDSHHLLPFDWGYFAVCYDADVMDNPPASLEDLTKPEYAKSLVVMDPRTSSPGFGFLLWTVAVYGDDYLDYWKRLAPSILTITESWSNGYGLFTSGEAPMVLSYSTSPIYHKMWEDIDRYRALPFAEGNYLQVEGVGLIKGAANPEEAKMFIDFMLSEEGQMIIATTNIMMPVLDIDGLPEAFEMGFISENPLLLDIETVEAGEGDWVQSWVEHSGL
ncbi:MAG: thiamine ABC transporter substrate binding subunit [Spirochaetales bacterium]|nr:thiamine ABC transporter substrate binding subunit [Spirochaetales bacterium]